MSLSSSQVENSIIIKATSCHHLDSASQVIQLIISNRFKFCRSRFGQLDNEILGSLDGPGGIQINNDKWKVGTVGLLTGWNFVIFRTIMVSLGSRRRPAWNTSTLIWRCTHKQTFSSFFLKFEGAQKNLKVHKQTFSYFEITPQSLLLNPPPWGDTFTNRQIPLFRSLWRSEVGTREAPSTARWQKIQKSVYSQFLSIWIWSRARSRSFIQIKYSLETLFSQHW